MKTAPIFLFFATTLLIIGCETGPALKTTSGRPEVFIANAAPGRVRAAIIDRGMSRGWTLERETENTITFVTKSNNVMASVLLASDYDPNVMDRLRFTTISVNGGTKVYATEELVSNHGSAFERVTPLQNNKNSNALQGVLESFKQQLGESKPATQPKAASSPGPAEKSTPSSAPEPTATP